MQEPLETAELLAFATTVEAKSLSRAAMQLAIPRATLSRRIARLEERLGTRLLRRTTRSLAVTDAGDLLYRHARIVLDAVNQAEASLRKSDDLIRGDLRVSVPPITDLTFYEMICEFCRQHPALRVHVHSSTQLVDLKRGGFDVALRGTAAVEPGLVARTLGKTPLLAVASPRYLAESPPLRTLKDLRQHRCLLGFARGELPQSHWVTKSGSRLHVEGVFSSNDILLLTDAALRGLGIAYLPSNVVHEHLQTGALVQVLPGLLESPGRVSVVYPERELLPPQVRAFVDAVIAWAPRGLRFEEPVKRSTSPTKTPRRRKAKREV